jgi:23S rRNA (adenine2503-C2)-methyltransferase
MESAANLLGLDLPGLEVFLQSLGERPFRARQLMQWVYKRGVLDFDAMTDLSRGVRARLHAGACLALPTLQAEQRSADGTRKLLLGLADGESVETVLIPEEDRITQCVSSQVGCAMGCAFCRTGAGGLMRNLSAAEIVGQVVLGQGFLGDAARITNVVFMGMGEPLHNLDNVVAAFRILSSDHGLNITKRRLTVSTCGLVPQLRGLPADVLGSLAVSLNATTDEVRDRLMPVNRRYPIGELLGTLRELPLPARARYTIEYVLLGGVNDSLADARRLVRLLSGLRCKVNLIAYNAHPDSPFLAPEPEAVEAFQGCLLAKSLTAVVRRSRGQDILAACGQLRAEGN